MNVYEMEGFLRGQCVPRDLLVNESIAAYLVRKLSEIASVKAERDALAVENAAMRYALDSIRIYSSDTLSGPSDSVPDMAAWLREGVEHLHQVSTIETPDTDSAIAAFEAQGVEKFADFLGKQYQCEKVNTAKGKAYKHVVFLACRFARELREAK